MKKSNFELATRTGGVQIKGGSINFDMAGLDSFADAIIKRELEGHKIARYVVVATHCDKRDERWFTDEDVQTLRDLPDNTKLYIKQE